MDTDLVHVWRDGQSLVDFVIDDEYNLIYSDTHEAPELDWYSMELDWFDPELEL